MAWETSDRRERLPVDWEQIRREVLEADDWTCQLRYYCCIGTATDVDHKKRGDDHRRENVQAACAPCHQVKSSREGAAARGSARRPPQRHPGLLR